MQADEANNCIACHFNEVQVHEMLKKGVGR